MHRWIAVSGRAAILSSMVKKILGLILLLVSVMGLFRLSFDTDILAVLPHDLVEVRGLEVQRDVLEDGGEVILNMTCAVEDAGLLKQEAESLSLWLVEQGVVAEARWRPVWEDTSEGLGELVAYMWMNGSHQELAGLQAKLAADTVQATVNDAVSRLGYVIDGQDLSMQAYDPFGFLSHSSVRALTAGAAEGGDGFESEDGQMYLLFLRPMNAISGYKESEVWLADVQRAAEAWQQAGDREWIEWSYTGGPVFEAEIGGSMERDMRGTVGLTMTLVCGLFWLFQRQLRPLFWLGAMLVVVFVITLGFGGLLFGKLSMMSAGFASILIGLAVDYGMVICQEGRVSTSDPGLLRKMVAPGIMWASVTTAAVFGSLGFSSLPGVQQLGLLVAIGIVVGATVMLVWYLPLVCRRTVLTPVAVGGRCGFLPSRLAASGLLLLLVVAGGILATAGIPGLNFDLAAMRPKDSKAMASLDAITAAFPAWQERGARVIVEADSDTQMLARLAKAQQRIDLARKQGELYSGKLPVGLWPDWPSQQRNNALLQQLVAARGTSFMAAETGGFNAAGLGLANSVFDAFERFLVVDEEVFPQSPASSELLRMMIQRHSDGGGVAMGEIEPTGIMPPDQAGLEVLRKIDGDGVIVAGWPLLSAAVLPMVHADIYNVFVPMVGVLVVMLIVVFRNAADVVLVFVCLLLPGMILTAAMRLLEVQWDILNITAVPLLLGMGMDYGIHMVLALRRHGKSPERVWNGIGKALLFCGLSTAIGFGALSFASSEALAGMGRICAIGILLTMGCSVFLLPGCWALLHGKKYPLKGGDSKQCGD